LRQGGAYSEAWAIFDASWKIAGSVDGDAGTLFATEIKTQKHEEEDSDADISMSVVGGDLICRG
jgi:hypothetical protein